MKSLFVLFVTLPFYAVSRAQSPVFVVDPVSVAAVEGSLASFSCIARNVEQVSYRVNGSTATDIKVVDKGFVEHSGENLGNALRRRNLTVIVSSDHNNTEIYCRGIGTDTNVNSKISTLTVQGSLSSVGGLSSRLMNSSTIKTSWRAPFTLPGTSIVGYNISIDSNGNITSDFTSDSFYVFQLSEVTGLLPCNETSITVSGYNGLDGEATTSSVPTANSTVPLSVNITVDLCLTVTMDMSNICAEERPVTVHAALMRDNITVYNMTLVSDDPTAKSLTSDYSPIIKEDTNYVIEASFNIFAGDFYISIRHDFRTFGVRSVVVNDSENDCVFCQCSFNSFSRDTGCTVQLLSDTREYVKSFSKLGKIAEGHIFGVETGQYQVNVFDQNSSIVVLNSEVMVIQESFTTKNYVTSSYSYFTRVISIPSTTTTSSSMSVAVQSVNTNMADDIPISIIAVSGAVIIIILFIVILTLVASVVWMKKHSSTYHNGVELSSDGNEDRYVQTNELPKRVEKGERVEDRMYAKLSEVEKKQRPFTRLADNRVIYSDLIIKGQPPPPPYQPVELKEVFNPKPCVTVIPTFDEAQYNYSLAVVERSPSTSTEGDPDLFVTPNNFRPQELKEEEKCFTNEKLHSPHGELISGNVKLQHGADHTPTGTHL